MINLVEALDKALLIIMAKWHGFGRCKTRLAKDIGKNNSAKIQSVMTKHTISVAKSLQKIKQIKIKVCIVIIQPRLWPTLSVNQGILILSTNGAQR